MEKCKVLVENEVSFYNGGESRANIGLYPSKKIAKELGVVIETVEVKGS